MPSVSPLSLLLMGIAYLYSLLIKIVFFPVTMVKNLFSGGGYKGYGQGFQLIDIAKSVTVAVVLISLFNEELISEIPAQWKQILGVICIVTASFSLFIVTQGFLKVILKSAFWFVAILFICKSFFPSFHRQVNLSKLMSSPFQSSSKNRSSKNEASFNREPTKFYVSRSDVPADLLKEPGLGNGSIFQKALDNRPMRFLQNFLGLKKSEPVEITNSPFFSKKSLPDNAYFSDSKKKTDDILPESLGGGK